MIYTSEAKIEKLNLLHVTYEGEETHKTELSNTDSEELDHEIFKLFFSKNIEPIFHSLDPTEAASLHQDFSEHFEQGYGNSETEDKISRLIDHIIQKMRRAGWSMDILVCQISGIILEEELCDVVSIGIFENRTSSLVPAGDTQVELKPVISLERCDKALHIFNIEEDSGYKIITQVRSQAKSELSFWKNTLPLITRPTDYLHTASLIEDTKDFIKDRATPLFDLDKTQEAEILGRSLNYLKHNESYDSERYSQEIFENPELRTEFKDYQQESRQLKQVEYPDQFDLNNDALKKKSSVFKSILKLDKNFHVYIHGNRERIKKGVDDDGRKYYIIFYDEER